MGMLLAIVGTLLHHEIVRYDWIIGGLVVGTVIGIPLGFMVPMTAMPQRIAISHMFGALAATLVGIVEYHEAAGAIDTVRMGALGFEVLFGALTVTGSFMAFGKLQELVPGRPVTYPGQNAVNIALFVATIGMLVYVVLHPLAAGVFYTMIALAFLIGIFDGAAHRRRGHAGGDLAAELLRGPGRLRHRLRHRQQRPHHRGRARRRLRASSSPCS